ncbi:disease resistance protein RLM3-like [Tripterygium wilfordii]|uniref:disease resistance protein RLM3-like n=1 Tax=Tripterygium wilfordii TaxID=458696 RepID=UPI0018F82788|nr:disease resistance protein RLM3-like [Tripterygium wilfordii]
MRVRSNLTSDTVGAATSSTRVASILQAFQESVCTNALPTIAFFSKPWIRDVFLSFTTDIGNNFTAHLFSALKKTGINSLGNDGENYGSDDLALAIQNSRISIIVFSKIYAASKWCLEQLVKIMECRKRDRQLVLPIFYDVDPSDVRKQNGVYAKALAKYEQLFVPEKMMEWRAALTDAANLSGWDVRNTDGCLFSPSIIISSQFVNPSALAMAAFFSKPWIHDVFLSFSTDTGNNFTAHLLFVLKKADINFLGNDNENCGSDDLALVIQNSRISIIVFCKNYAASRWCLEQLVKIMECRQTIRRLVLPIFYDVDPSDVWKQNGVYA